jgi:hypothetical protein
LLGNAKLNHINSYQSLHRPALKSVPNNKKPPLKLNNKQNYPRKLMKTKMNPKSSFVQSGRVIAWLIVTFFALSIPVTPRAHAQSGGPGKDRGVVMSIDDAVLEIRDGSHTRSYTETDQTRWLNSRGQRIDAGDVVGKKVEVRWRWITGGSEALEVKVTGPQDVGGAGKSTQNTSKAGGNAPSNKSSMDAPDTAVEAQQFVDNFYKWYVPFSAHSKTLACKEVLNAHREYFSRALYPMLKKNIADMERTHGLGLGFDPFLNSQDPASKYMVGPADGTDEGYAMEVYSVQDGHRQSKPDVIAVVENQHNSWVLTNFHYPDQGKSLRQLLRAQRD